MCIQSIFFCNSEPEEDPVPSFSGVSNNVEEIPIDIYTTVINGTDKQPPPSELPATNTNLPINNIHFNGISTLPSKEERKGRRTSETVVKN